MLYEVITHGICAGGHQRQPGDPAWADHPAATATARAGHELPLLPRQSRPAAHPLLPATGGSSGAG